MHAYDRWLMRPSGEARHQAQGPAEGATFAVLDWLRTENLLDGIITSSESHNCKVLDGLIETVGIALDRHERPMPLPPERNLFLSFLGTGLLGAGLGVLFGFFVL